MFEDSLMESAHTIKATSKYWSFVGLLINSGLLLILIVWPLLHPEALPKQMMAALLLAPPPPPSPPPAVHSQVHSQPKLLAVDTMAAPSRIPKTISSTLASETPPFMQGVIEGLDSGPFKGVGVTIGGAGTAPSVVVKAAPPRKVSISSGVMAGNLLQKTLPQYPAIARAGRIQGTVVLQATISKLGTIDNLRVVSGLPMLQQAAMDAVRTWRYKPYLLNGEPVEVETTVNIVFSLGE